MPLSAVLQPIIGRRNGRRVIAEHSNLCDEETEPHGVLP